jgi:hypothetical protein
MSTLRLDADHFSQFSFCSGPLANFDPSKFLAGSRTAQLRRN